MGDDLLAGDEGRDIYLFGTPTDPGWGNDTISDSDPTPGGGVNVLSFAGVDGNRNVTVTLSPGPEATDGTNAVEWVDAGDFRKVVGGSGDDVITGDEWPNIIDGGFGANTINGG
ncbi:MAG TPA: hypothetical protein VHM69_19970 [Rubrobacter sp.]|nr:hypothetical protein [Rubrobacter sp.]